MKKLFIVIIALFLGFQTASAAKENTNLRVNLSEQVIKELGYDWYAERFEGDCTVILEFEITAEGRIELLKVTSNQTSVTKYLENKLKDFSIASNNNVSALQMKLSFKEV